jgi:rhamnose transport system ATP-binding protein
MIQVTGVSKAFGVVRALTNVDFAAAAGELNGAPLTIRSPHEARQAGIALVSQDLQLVPSLSLVENIYLGVWPGGSFTVDWRSMREQVKDLLARLHVQASADTPVARLSQEQWQLVGIARALVTKPQVLLLDEPTSALALDRVESLFDLLRELRDQGTCIVFVSHRLQEIFALAERVTVLRDGQHVGTVDVADTNEAELVGMMVGRSLQSFYHKEDVPIGEPVLSIKHLSRGLLQDVSFDVHAGEIVGLAGLAGSGRSALARTLFGLRSPYEGEICIGGQVVNPRSPAGAMAAGIALVPENRKEQGLVMTGTVRTNMTLASLHDRSNLAWLSNRAEQRTVHNLVRELRIKTPEIDAPVRQLSGGTQQKVVLAKWLLVQPKLFILDEPTQGVDIGAKAEIYELVGRLVREGRGVLLISSELPELLALSDRIISLYQGRISGVLDRASATEQLVAQKIVTGQ